MKNKSLYVIGIILVLGLLAYVVIKPTFQDKNNLESKNYQIYSDNKINFSIPSELEQYKTSFGSDNGIILSKFKNDIAVISITVVSSSTNLNYVWTENCGSTTSCGHARYTQDYFTREYDGLIKLYPNISAMSLKTIKDGADLQNSYEKTVLINENIIFGAIVVFDTESEDLTRVTYSYSSDLNNEFDGYKNTILKSLKFN
ncbi:MAG: hypothetical protein Q8N99_07855 [Nanoarchaeota archaeon]|nr:hypothetical protein [Nanoarchaeota archaeon]